MLGIAKIADLKQRPCSIATISIKEKVFKL
jgi:hypothetical protein